MVTWAREFLLRIGGSQKPARERAGASSDRLTTASKFGLSIFL